MITYLTMLGLMLAGCSGSSSPTRHVSYSIPPQHIVPPKPAVVINAAYWLLAHRRGHITLCVDRRCVTLRYPQRRLARFDVATNRRTGPGPLLQVTFGTPGARDVARTRHLTARPTTVAISCAHPIVYDDLIHIGAAGHVIVVYSPQNCGARA